MAHALPPRLATTLTLLVVGAASLALRFLLLDVRWVNPDEGAHLMDAVMALDGQIPEVDFSARQPFYVYVNAAVLWLLGTSHDAGRVLPLICSFLTGLVLYWLGVRLFDRQVAALATVLFWVTPLEVLNSVVVKTEPLVMLLTALSFAVVVEALRRDRPALLVAAGVAAAMGYYVRESALAIAPAVLFVLLVHHGRGVGRAVKQYAVFLGGAFAVFLPAMAFYARYLPLESVLRGSVSPFGMPIALFERLVPGLGSDRQPTAGTQLPPEPEVAANPLSFDPEAPWTRELYLNYIRDAGVLHAVLILGAVFAVILLVWRLARGGGLEDRFLKGAVLPIAWAGFLGLAYSYYFVVRGFYIDYFRELLPPLALLTSAWLLETVPAVRAQRRLPVLLVAVVAVGALLYLLQTIDRGHFGLAHHGGVALALFGVIACWLAPGPARVRAAASAACGLLAAVALLWQDPPTKLHLVLAGAAGAGLPMWLWSRSAGPRFLAMSRVGALALLFATFVLSATYAGVRLDRRYDAVWSQESVETITALLRERTRPGDRVLSGAVVWELNAGRRPFEDFSHPLAFEFGIGRNDAARILEGARDRPPRAIVLDGYVEQTYLRHLPQLQELIDRRYRLVGEAGPANHPVLLYELVAETPADASS